MYMYVYVYACICVCIYTSPYAFLQRVSMHSQVLLSTMHAQMCMSNRCCEHNEFHQIDPNDFSRVRSGYAGRANVLAQTCIRVGSANQLSARGSVLLLAPEAHRQAPRAQLFCRCYLYKHSNSLLLEPDCIAAASSTSTTIMYNYVPHLTSPSPLDKRAKSSQVNKEQRVRCSGLL